MEKYFGALSAKEKVNVKMDLIVILSSCDPFIH